MGQPGEGGKPRARHQNAGKSNRRTCSLWQPNKNPQGRNRKLYPGKQTTMEEESLRNTGRGGQHEHTGQPGHPSAQAMGTLSGVFLREPSPPELFGKGTGKGANDREVATGKQTHAVECADRGTNNQSGGKRRHRAAQAMGTPSGVFLREPSPPGLFRKGNRGAAKVKQLSTGEQSRGYQECVRITANTSIKKCRQYTLNQETGWETGTLWGKVWPGPTPPRGCTRPTARRGSSPSWRWRPPPR